MPIKYDKLIALMKEKNITSYTLKRDKIIGQATYKNILDGKDIDTRTIAKLCELLNCQPGDILEYSPEDSTAPDQSEDSSAASSVPDKEESQLKEKSLSVTPPSGAQELGDSPAALDHGKDISELDLSVCALNHLKRKGINTVGDFLREHQNGTIDRRAVSEVFDALHVPKIELKEE